MEDATVGLTFNKEEQAEIAKEMDMRLRKDKIKWLEDRGYRVILNNTKDNRNRDNDMIAVLVANGYTVTKKEG
jgi:carbamate kinase